MTAKTAKQNSTVKKRRCCFIMEKKMTPLFGNAVNEYYLDLIRKNYIGRKTRLAAIRTREDAERYVAEVKAKIAKCFTLPAEKTPLNPVITGTRDFGSYEMRKIVYYSRPEFPVTGSLYMPKTSGKVPAILFLCGHSENGRASEAYQTCQRAFAEKGYAVLAIDPVSQGERHQFTDIPEFKGGCTSEHNTMGKQLVLSGDTMGSWRAWDAIRGVDYLETLPEVDTSRIGVIGNSGGGTMTTFVNALEERFIMAAPSCYITTWKNNVENELPVDAEQIPTGAAGAGLEMSDFLIARAPRPLIILAKSNDFFDPRGTQDTYEEVRRIYKLLGAEDMVQRVFAEGGHGLGQVQREAAYGFFSKVAGVDTDAKEPEIAVLSEAEIFSAPAGQVKNLPVNKFLREFAAEQADELAANRKVHTKAELRDIMRELLKLDQSFVPHFRSLRSRYKVESQDKVTVFSRFGLETEPDGRLMSVLKLKNPGYFSLPPKTDKVTLYIPHLDSEDELMEMDYPAEGMLYGLDVRGVGECTPAGCDQPEERNFFAPYQFDYHYASLGILLDKSYLGGKVKDILCAIELLTRNGEKLELQARGQGTVPAIIAALFCDKISSVKLIDAPESWGAQAHMVIPSLPLSAMLFNVLKETDLPEIRKVLGI